MREPFDHYVALGDSMSIDDYPGPGLGAASLLYRNVDAEFPEFAGRDLSTRWPGIGFAHLARDGATTREVMEALDELSPLSGRVLFTLTVGGNDLLRGRLRDLRGAIAAYRENLEAILERLLRDYAGRCRVLQALVYDPTDGVGDLMSGTPNPGLVRFLTEANRVIAEAAQARPEVTLADVHAHFLGHGSHATDPANPHYRAHDPTPWLKLGIEPNERGGSEVRRVFWETLAEAEGW